MKADGEIHLVDRETGRTRTEGTYQCCHCARHITIQNGSGKLRGFCLRCHKVTCGRPCCDACVHWRQKEDNLAGGLNVNHRPVIVQSADVGGLSTR